LSRVRDWRGRATSILPAAQSGSDLSDTTHTNGALFTKQLAQTRSLLETDNFAPNTWFAMNSSELLLNVSLNVAGDEEFPIIKLADPSGTVVVPYDLDRGFTELIVNGFRLKPKSGLSIIRQTKRQNAVESEEGVTTTSGPDFPITSGPYPFSTYLPLFAPEPEPKRFFAYMGETGNDLLVGFLADGIAKSGVHTRRFQWLESKTQVILEDAGDKDPDFAWSLSCDAQGDLLACRIPRDEISLVYRGFLTACPGVDSCPGLGKEKLSIQMSLNNTQTVDALKRKDLAKFNNAYLSNMRLSIEQSDIEGNDVFYSQEPARISVLPLSDDHWTDVSFKSWEFGGADSDSVTLQECQYLPNINQCNISVSLLGVRSWRKWISQTPKSSFGVWERLTPGLSQTWERLTPELNQTSDAKCGHFTIPTASLANDPVVFTMALPDRFVQDSPTDLAPCKALGSSDIRDSTLRPTIAIARSRLAPHFLQPVVTRIGIGKAAHLNNPGLAGKWEHHHSGCALHLCG
jgi:hypothetical protein